MPQLRTRLLYITGVILISLIFGTVGFVLIEHQTVFNAFYFTLITITTVGYGETFPLSHAGRIFNSFLIFFGVTTMFLAIGGVTQTVIELELNQFFGKRRVRKMIDKLRDHYIVCGFGRIGRGAALELQRAEVPFLIIDLDESKVEAAIKEGMLAALADSVRDETLLDVGIMRAKGLIATLGTDADNLFLILSAKSLNSKVQVSARIAEEDAAHKFRLAGADFVFAPYHSTGNRMSQALLKPHVFQFMDFSTGEMNLNVSIEQVRVGETSGFASRSLEESHVRQDFGVIVLAIRKSSGKMIFNPPADAQLHGGDYLVVMGEPLNLRKLEERAQA